MRVRITGSKVHRVWKCPPSAVLPQIEDTEPSPPAERGKAIHAFLEDVGRVGVAEAIAAAPAEHRPYLEILDLENLPTTLATEVAFLYDWRARRAREIGRNIGRDYAGHLERTGQEPIAPTEIACTLDLVGVEERGATRRGYCGDYKTGHTRYPSPDRFGQTLLGALCVRSVYGCDDVVVELLYLGRTGEAFPSRRTLDEWDLEIFADELAAAMDLVDHAEAELAAGRGVDVRTGPHCQHCPAYLQCPATTSLVRAVPTELVSLGYTRPVLAAEAAPAPGTVAAGAITRARAAEIYEACERIEAVLAHVREQICMMAAHGEIELSDGRVIGRLVTRRELLDGPIAASVVEQWFGTEARDKAITISMSKDALLDAVRAHVAGRKAAGEKLKISGKKGDGVLDRILAEIRARGGIQEAVSDAIKPHVPRRKALKE